MNLENFTTCHKTDAYQKLTITWNNAKTKGSFETWITKEFRYELPSTQEMMITNWAKERGASIWGWKFEDIEK